MNNRTWFALFLILAVFGCTAQDKDQDPLAATNLVVVKAVGLEFEGPAEIASGWTTFRLINESEMIHFGLIQRPPEGIGIKEQQEQVAPVFQQGMDLLNEGRTDEAMAKFQELPEWFHQVEFLGGPGFVSGGDTATTTVYLEPGRYLMECYVKTVGIFHSYNPTPDEYGMVLEFTVVSGTTATSEPKASATVTISGKSGISLDSDLTAGTHTIAVHFEDQNPHENFVGHDVHLVRLEPATDLEELATWMDWTHPDGLEVPAPAAFLGGSNEMPGGSTAYLTVDLEPGQYAWIAEVPGPREKGMLQTFTVTP